MSVAADGVPELERFGPEEAWRVGSGLVERCRADGAPVVIGITLGEQRVFHAALPGASADNDAWAERKSAVVRRFGRSSQAVDEQAGDGDRDAFLARFGLDPARYAVTGGAVPIRVRGALVGVLVISGLTSEEDHALGVAALAAEAAAAHPGP